MVVGAEVLESRSFLSFPSRHRLTRGLTECLKSRAAHHVWWRVAGSVGPPGIQVTLVVWCSLGKMESGNKLFPVYWKEEILTLNFLGPLSPLCLYHPSFYCQMSTDLVYQLDYTCAEGWAGCPGNVHKKRQQRVCTRKLILTGVTAITEKNTLGENVSASTHRSTGQQRARQQAVSLGRHSDKCAPGFRVLTCMGQEHTDDCREILLSIPGSGTSPASQFFRDEARSSYCHPKGKLGVHGLVPSPEPRCG